MGYYESISMVFGLITLIFAGFVFYDYWLRKHKKSKLIWISIGQ